ncbi:MAG TPA: tetratricopeptide repeat protein [Bacteroidales bacterium]|nr:tetratricopeptide repeat protein [Bacteroidales bacterium]
MVSKHEIKIDTLNESLWENRYSDPSPLEKKALKLLKDAGRMNYQRGIAYAHLNLAALSFLRSENDNALRHLSESFQWLKTRKKEKGYIRYLLLKGNILESIGHYDKTLKLWLEALNISRETDDPESESEACNQLGLVWLRLGNYKRSLDFFRKGLEIRIKLNDEKALASSFNRIGMVLREMKRYDESLDSYFRSLEIRKRIDQTQAIQWTLLGIASTYEKMKKFPESLEYYEQGAKEGDRRCILQCLLGAGRVQSRLGFSGEAEEKIRKALSLARELKSLSLTSEAHIALADHYELNDQPKRALRSFRQYLKSREAFQSREMQNRLRNIEVTHAIEKSEQEKEIFRLRNVELKNAYDIIEEKNMDITANISYAGRIQMAVLPDINEIPGMKENCFILYIPKDVIGGDFYWFSMIKGKLVLIVADCTGHGVPGALMSILGISFLEDIINTKGIDKSHLILDELSRKVVKALKQKGYRNETRDGMDISVCVIDRDLCTLQFSGAHNNLYLTRNNELKEYPADRQAVGYSDEPGTGFTSQTIDISHGDIIYLTTDGYTDQLGGKDHKRFKSQAFRSLLLKIHKKPLAVQKKILEKEFNRWKGKNIQTDDVLVFGMSL